MTLKRTNTRNLGRKKKRGKGKKGEGKHYFIKEGDSRPLTLVLRPTWGKGPN